MMHMGYALCCAQIEFVYLPVCTQYTVHTITADYILTRMYTVHSSHHNRCLYTYPYVHSTQFTP
jgi:hypothetical protein